MLVVFMILDPLCCLLTSFFSVLLFLFLFFVSFVVLFLFLCIFLYLTKSKRSKEANGLEVVGCFVLLFF